MGSIHHVTWNFSTGTSGTSHTLTTPLTVGASGQANNPLVVTLTNDASCGVEGGLCPLARLRGEATADANGRLSIFVAVP